MCIRDSRVCEQLADGGSMSRDTRDCDGCQSRRQFFGCVTASLTGALVLPVIADALDLLPVVEAEGAQASGSEHAYPIPAQDSVTIDKKAQIILCLLYTSPSPRDS